MSQQAERDAAAGQTSRPRILYFMVGYPAFSETYMHEEIRALRQRYDIRILTYLATPVPRRDPFPYEVIEYRDTCFVYGPIDKIDREFSRPAQQEFLARVDAVIEAFRPDVLHGHYLGMALLFRKLAEKHHIPFTIRTHSFDVLSEPGPKLEAMCEAAGSPWCLRVLAFPASCERLADAGLAREKIAACWPVFNFARFHRPERRPATGRILCTGPAIKKKAQNHFVDLAAKMRGSGLTFDLYAQGPTLELTRAHNEMLGSPVNITYADPDEMPEVFPRYDWLVYPSNTKISKVGLPISILEAQASGVGVCWQELPGRREEQLDFLGGAGFLFSSIDEVPEIITRPYPEEMRQRGMEIARRSDIGAHGSLVTDAWDRILAAGDAAA
jgi:glycosyltransferase involved in cell wall biosynthesis